MATVFTLLILWTAFGSVFALLLGYSRIPYAAAETATSSRRSRKLHPTKRVPVRLAARARRHLDRRAAFFSLGMVIDALITTRILVQFIGQIVALTLLRKKCPEGLPYRMWLYPVPAVIAFVGWAYVFLTSGWAYIAVGLATLAAGVIAFLLRAKVEAKWPFAGAAVQR